MSFNSRMKGNSITSKLTIIFLALVLVLGLFATSYQAGFTFVIGVLLFSIGWGVLWLSRRIFSLRIRYPLLFLVTSLLALGIIVLLLIGLSRYPFLGRTTTNQLGDGKVENENIPRTRRANQPRIQPINYDLINTDIVKYQAFIEPINESLNSFNIEEELVFKYTSEFEKDEIAKTQIIKRLKEVINQDEYIKEVVSKKMGFLLNQDNSTVNILNRNIEINHKSIFHAQGSGFALKKASFLPLREIYFSSVNNSSPLNIEIINLPKGSFYAAESKKIENIERNEFVDNETIKWSTDNIHREIKFAYFSFPYYYFSPILKLFTGISSFSKGILTMLGVISGYVVTNFNNLGLLKILQGWLEKKLEEFRTRKKVLTEPNAEVLMGKNSPAKDFKASASNESLPQINLEDSKDELEQ